jgi:hypothetical protein
MPSLILPLTIDGAIAEVLVGVSHQRAMALLAGQQVVPAPVRVRLLVDTGATTTNISYGLLTSLGLVPTGSVPVHTTSTGASPVNCDGFDVSLVFPDAQPNGWGFPSIPIIERLPLQGPVDGLIVRDVLDRSILTHNSFSNVVTISF